MQLVILAGGKGTRISEESYLKPKPLIEIGEKPIIWHIMKYYSSFGINEFVICCGYKSYLLKEYFANFHLHTSDMTINLKNNKVNFNFKNKEEWKITLIDTGLETQTGGRIKKIKKYINKNDFCLTYGDGLSNVDIKGLINFHKKHKKIASVTVVQPSGKFGAVTIEKDLVTKFQEKPRGDSNWINGGFFVLNKKIFKYLEGDETIWEKEPLEELAKNKNLKAFRHKGFWQPMDTLRDRNLLNDLWNNSKAPWKIWNE